MKVAYCTGFWSTNLGNGFFSLGVEYVLKKLLGDNNVTVVSDLQTYTNSFGKRHYPDKFQLDYLSQLDVDYIVLSGPVLSRFFISLWKDILLKLRERGIGYIILSAGVMKLDANEQTQLIDFFKECPPYIFTSRDSVTYKNFSKYATNAYNGICFSFFAPDYYHPCSMPGMQPYIALNFDKIDEPDIWTDSKEKKRPDLDFEFAGNRFFMKYPLGTKIALKTDRFTDALVYAFSMLPAPNRPDKIDKYTIIRTDHRFHPHFRNKIYRYNNSFCADLPYGYLNLYANAACTLSDRVHACAVTLAYGNSAMLFSKTNRTGLLERVGAVDVGKKPTKIDLVNLRQEKNDLIQWLENAFYQKDIR